MAEVDIATSSVIEIAEKRWRLHPMHWPVPPRRRPRWWQWRQRNMLADLEAVFGHLDDAALGRWWTECHKGQSVYEDAGGYMLRCYLAMIGLAVEEPLTYAQAIETWVDNHG